METKWNLWKCGNWRQWTTVEKGPFSEIEHSGKPCNFSGCDSNHKQEIVGVTDNADFAQKWFRGYQP